MSKLDIPIGARGKVTVELGERDQTTLEVTVVRRHANGPFYGFRLAENDAVWRQCVNTLEPGRTGTDQ